MLNLTSRLAIEMRNIPGGVNCSDSKPQGSRKLLTAADILPHVDDAAVLRKRALLYLQHFLVTDFIALRKLRPLVPTIHPSGPVRKSVVVPMKILFRDEKYAAENVAIMMDLVKDANLQGSDEVTLNESASHNRNTFILFSH